jgi:hypothetical protein
MIKPRPHPSGSTHTAFFGSTNDALAGFAEAFPLFGVGSILFLGSDEFAMDSPFIILRRHPRIERLEHRMPNHAVFRDLGIRDLGIEAAARSDDPRLARLEAGLGERKQSRQRRSNVLATRRPTATMPPLAKTAAPSRPLLADRRCHGAKFHEPPRMTR